MLQDPWYAKRAALQSRQISAFSFLEVTECGNLAQLVYYFEEQPSETARATIQSSATS